MVRIYGEKIIGFLFGECRKWILLPCIIFAAVEITDAAAYYTDLIRDHENVRSAVMNFLDGSGKASIDLSEEEAAFMPLRAGEGFTIRISTKYIGETDCYAVPKLTVKKETAGAQAIRILALENGEDAPGAELVRVSESEADAAAWSPVTRMRPGESREFLYRIESLEDQREPLELSYGFSLAAVQSFMNEDLETENILPEDAYAQILAQHQGEASKRIGFTAMILQEEVMITGTDLHLTMRPQAKTIRFAPVIRPGNPARYTFRLYTGNDGGSLSLYTEHTQDESTQISYKFKMYPNQRPIYARYEVQNEAGFVMSPIYRIACSGEEVSVHEMEDTMGMEAADTKEDPA